MLCFTSKLCETPFSIKLSPETYLDRVSAPPHVIQLLPALQPKFESLHDVDSFRNREEVANDGIARTIEPQNCLLVIL